MTAHAIALPARALQDRDSQGGQRTVAVTIMAVAFLTAIFAAAAKGMGGDHGLAGLLRFREDGPGVGAMGLAVLALFVASAAATCGALAGGGRERLLSAAANVSVKVTLLVAVAFMFAFPHLSQFESKSLTLRAVLYPLFACGAFGVYRLRGMRGPYPTLIDLCWSFTFTFDIVSNDLHWYGTWRHWDDFVHFLNSVPFIVLIVVTLLAFEREGSIRLGFWGAALVGLAVYTAGHALWEMYEFSMDRFAGTNLQPGGMEEASRNNLAGSVGALLGILLLWLWRRAGSLAGAVVEPLASYIAQLCGPADEPVGHDGQMLDTVAAEVYRSRPENTGAAGEPGVGPWRSHGHWCRWASPSHEGSQR